MNTYANKTQEHKSQSASTADYQVQNSSESNFQFVDNRPEAVAQRKLKEFVNNSPQAEQLRSLQRLAYDDSVIQKKSNGKQGLGLVDNRPEAISQGKIQSNVIQMGQGFSKMAAPATTKVMGQGSKVFRATTQSSLDLTKAGGMTRLGSSKTFPAYRAPLYMMFSFSNPGVISTARSLKAAQDFGMGLQQRNQEEGIHDPIYIYEIDAAGQRAIDMEKTVPKLFQWLYSSEQEEMIFEDIPEDKIKLLMSFGKKEDDEQKK